MARRSVSIRADTGIVGVFQDASGKHESFDPERVVEVVAPHPPVAFARVDHHAVAFVQPDVRDQRLACVAREKQQIAPLQPPARTVAGS